MIAYTHVQITREGPVLQSWVVTLDDYLGMPADELAGTVVRLLTAAEADVVRARREARAS